ncbi:MAG: hypothetical protein Q7T55_15625, partial [Solirubrobacteraceae bacterium]|nr:hypothetical protein [Solirubrobacteraceae bacterium]
MLRPLLLRDVAKCIPWGEQLKFLTHFMVLIERRRAPVLGVVAAATLVAALFHHQLAHAAPVDRESRAKIARDLDDETDPVRKPRQKWARDVNGVRHVQAVIVTNTADPEMSELRAEVLRGGGSVQAVLGAVHAMTVTVKASQLASLAQRADVVSVAPNRPTQRTASTLEAITGV